MMGAKRGRAGRRALSPEGKEVGSGTRSCLRGDGSRKGGQRKVRCVVEFAVESAKMEKEQTHVRAKAGIETG